MDTKADRANKYKGQTPVRKSGEKFPSWVQKLIAKRAPKKQ
jgi:hypothetical protein